MILSSQIPGSDWLVLGGTAETVLTLEAPKNRPTDVIDLKWETMDEIRVTADTRGRNYRGFQSSERQDPFSMNYERAGYTDQERYRATREFTVIQARDALAIGRPEEALGNLAVNVNPIKTILGGSPRGWLRPPYSKESADHAEDPDWPRWQWVSSHYEASGGYFAETTGNKTATFYFDLTPIVAPDSRTRIDPGKMFVGVRVFGSEEIVNKKRVPGRVRLDDSENPDDGNYLTPNTAYVGFATMVLNEEGGLPGEVSCGYLKHGETLVSHLDVSRIMYIEGNCHRYILGVMVTSKGQAVDPEPWTFTLGRIEVSLSGPDTQPLVAGTPGSYNVAQHENYTRAEHWDGMMPTRGRVGFIAMGGTNRVPTLEETGKLATQLTTFPSGDVQGLINVNTSPRSTLICLPWACPPLSGMDEEEFILMYDWNCLMTQAVTNARGERALKPLYQEVTNPKKYGEDNDGDGFIYEDPYKSIVDLAKAGEAGGANRVDGPYETIGDLARAIRAIRWTLLGRHKQPDTIDWSDFLIRRSVRVQPMDLVKQELEQIYGEMEAPRDQTYRWIEPRIARLEKEVFSRVSNLITVQSNVFEIVTRAGVVARVPETDETTNETINVTLNLAKQSDRIIADRR